MKLTLAIHPVTEMRFGTATKLAGTRLDINKEELQKSILEDKRLRGVDLEIVRPGENCRIGMVFDIVEPRAKEPGSGPNFPGIVDLIAPVGQGTTHVLRGAAVTVVDEGLREAPSHSARGATKLLEMSGAPAQASPYGSLQHLVVVTHPQPELEWHAAWNAMRVASVKAAVYLAKAAIGQRPATNEMYESDGALVRGREGLPRLAYIGQIHGHQHGTETDEHILYGGNTVGMMPMVLHPNEWFDGALCISYSWTGGVETYFYQNQPILKELYRRHQAGELTFVGTIAMTAASKEEDRARNTALAAHLAQQVLGANGVIVTRYSQSGAPQADMFETARLCEIAGMKTVVLASGGGGDGSVESAALMHIAEVNALVCTGGGDLKWSVPAAERVIAGNPKVAAKIGVPQELGAGSFCGVLNMQGASRVQAMIY